jgi:G6PDH family F420-dependent oxidoreductase
MSRRNWCVDVMRALFRGEEVTHRGLVEVDRARLWTLPADPPALIGAAVSVETARWVGDWADGLITVNQDLQTSRAVLGAFREGEGGDKPAYMQVHVSWAESEDEALAIAHDQWRSNVFGPPLSWDLELPQHFDQAAAHVRPEDVAESVLISSDPARLRDRLCELADLGFDGIWIHHVGKSQRRFIEVFGAEVVPTVRGVRS